jgi:hypothetical protein
MTKEAFFEPAVKLSRPKDLQPGKPATWPLAGIFRKLFRTVAGSEAGMTGTTSFECPFSC